MMKENLKKTSNSKTGNLNEIISQFKESSRIIDDQLNRVETAVSTIMSMVGDVNTKEVSMLNRKIREFNRLKETNEKAKKYLERLENNSNDSKEAKMVIVSSMIKLFDEIKIPGE